MKRHILILALLTSAQAQAVEYTYDALGRLRAESYANHAHILYTYDALGNRTKREVIPPNASPSADLAVTVSLAPDPPVDGGALTATVTITNHGPDAAPKVAVAPELPAGFTPLRISASQGVASLADGAELGLLAAGESATVTIEGAAQGVSDLAFTATATSAADSSPDNNSASAIATPSASADLAITRFTVGPNPLTLPTPATYTVEIANLGPSAATDVSLSTTLAAGTTFVSADPPSTETGGVVTTPLGNLAVGDTVIVTLTVGAAGLAQLPAGQQNNFFCLFTASASESDPVNANSKNRPAGPIYQSPTLLVTNADDAGPGSLRQAILDANANPNRDIIAFDIPGDGVPKLTPIVTFNAATKIPLATPMLIDGFTQPGGLVEIDLSQVNALAGLEIVGVTGVGLRGLVLNNAGPFTPAILIDDTRPGDVPSRDITIQGCRIGVTVDGAAALPNDDGIQIFASDNILIGGSEPWMGNLISGNAGKGIVARSNTGLRIQGNRIGTNLAGNAAVPNEDGVELGLGGGLLGGSAPGAGNLISGNTENGVEAGEGAIVQGNLIGLDVSGTLALPNGLNGVSASRGSQIGGFTPGERNVIAGNPVNVAMSFDSVSVAGNFIGADLTGTKAINPANFGVLANSGHVGLPVEGGGNLISGCVVGISFSRSDVFIQNNRIGADASGMFAVPNTQAGILLTGGSRGFIGGSSLHDGNLISGNTGAGIQSDRPLFGSPAGNLTIQGNIIGAKRDGTPLGNGGAGIAVNSGQGFHIGGLNPGEGNLIAFNNGPGIAIKNSSGSNAAFLATINHRISGNSIHSNSSLGIDLGADDGVTPNDPLDVDNPLDGGNQMQNFPLITAANSNSQQITGTFSSAPSKTYHLEMFSNIGQDASGHGEGQMFLGFLEVVTDETGNANFDVVTDLPFPAGSFIAGTATDPDGNTSEFSPATLAGSDNPTLPEAVDDIVHRIQGQNLRLDIASLLSNDNSRNNSALTLVSVSSRSSAGATVALVDSFVVYDPINENDTTSDSFTYTVSNGEGTAQATVTIQVVSLNLSVALLDQGGQLTMAFSGIPGRRYQLQFSLGLTQPISWQNIGDPATAPSSGVLNFSDSPTSSIRFYRVIEVL